MKVCSLFPTEERDKDQSSLPVVKLGAIGVNRASDARRSSFRVKVGETVHIKCRNNYIKLDRNLSKSETSSADVPEQVITSPTSTVTFDITTQCVLCGFPAKYDHKTRKKGSEVHPVLTLEFQKLIGKVCDVRNDDWFQKVKSRIAHAQDLRKISTSSQVHN